MYWFLSSDLFGTLGNVSIPWGWTESTGFESDFSVLTPARARKHKFQSKLFFGVVGRTQRPKGPNMAYSPPPLPQILPPALTAISSPAPPGELAASPRLLAAVVGRTDGLSDGRRVGRSVGRSDGRTGSRTSGRSDGLVVGRAVGRTGGRAGGRTGGRTDGRTDCRTDGGWDGRSDGRTDGRVVGRADARTDGR